MATSSYGITTQSRTRLSPGGRDQVIYQAIHVDGSVRCGAPNCRMMLGYLFTSARDQTPDIFLLTGYLQDPASRIWERRKDLALPSAPRLTGPATIRCHFCGKLLEWQRMAPTPS